MDTIISKYFCIFCENCTNFESMSEAYNHYNNHMKYWYYCPDCDNQRKCNENHSNDAISEEERSLIEMWIERFLSYQSELIEKTYEDLFRSTKLFSGCAVCETFLRLCTNNDIKYMKGDIHWSSNQSTANESRHVCSHLRYYPFECYHCEKVGKYHKKCDMSEITRHIRNSHSMSVRNPNFETMIKSVKIRKLENLIEFNFKNRNQKQPNTPGVVEKGQPPPPLPPPQPSTPTPLSPIRSSRRLINQLSRPPQQPPVMSEPPTKRPKVGTQMIVINSNNNNNNQNNVKTSPTKVSRNTMICNQKNDLILNIRKPNINSNSKTIIQNINNGGKADQRISTQSKAKVEIKFKPIVKTLPNLMIGNQIIRTKQNNLISGDQIIIKKVSDSSNVGPKPISLIHKSAAKVTTKPVIHTMKSLSLSQQFSDMMDEEEEELHFKLDSNRIIQNVSYFCIFCPQKISDKEEAYRHLQRHVDYYPIVCLLCGEGLTDCQSFMKHHRESHPEALKGKYKKKEQPIIDKWISSFLYSQATIIRSFPPRESCPVCDLLFTHSDIMKNKPRRCTVNRKIDHLYRHLSYLPYECILCRQTGQEFLVAYFESKAHSHIKLKHPEIDDNEERWQVFQKTISIPKLDEFIENYLSEFGISMQLERRPVKKANKYGTSPEPFATSSNASSSATNKFDNSSLNLNMIFSDIMETPNETNKNHRIKPENEMIVDNKKESPLLNEFNNNSNDSNIIVSVSPLNLFDKSTSDDIEEEEEDMFFCIFCPQTQYFTKMEAYSHYGSHLDYNPVLCKICSQSFSDVDHLMTHHQSVHTTQDNVDYEIREDQVLVKWVNEFLESQKSIKKVMPCSCSYNCPVCLKLIGNELSDISMPCTQHNDVIFSVHIHKHLNYFPYECLTCKRNNRLVRVPNLDAMAMNHLKEHNIMNASMSQVVRSFPKTLVISQLEKLIGDSVHRKRVSEKKNRFDINTNRYDLDILPQTMSNTSLKAISIPKSEPSTSRLSPIRPQHIRLEGGRVVNLPQRARLLADNGMTVLSIRGREVDTNGSNNQLINKIRCFHCRKYFPDKKLFKIHHNQSHPGKPILCSKSL